MAVDELSKYNDDGTRLGQDASDKISFYGATTIVQPVGAGQAAVTNTTTGTSTTTALTTDLDNLRTLVLAIRTALVNLGLIKGAA